MNTEHFFRVMECFLPPSSPVGVAVSGGIDSMFLACNLFLWGRRHGVEVVPLIVSHGLRSCSEQEAEQVAQWLVSMNMNPHILSGTLICGTTGIQEKARRFRYGLLSAAAHHMGLSHIFLGHQKDDLLETVFMREEAKSGWRGLAGMSSIVQRHGITWVRPLLSFSRQELHKWLVEHSVPWVDDSSNHQDHFTRVRVRKILHTMSSDTKEALYQRTCDYGYARQEESIFLAQHMSPMINDALGYVRMPFSKIQKIVTSSAMPWVMQNWIYSFVAGKRPLKAASLINAWGCIEKKWKMAKKGVLVTVGGALWIRYKDDLFVVKESFRVPPPILEGWIKGHSMKKSPLPVWWDYRFLCRPSSEKQDVVFSVAPWLQKLCLQTFPSENILENFYKKYVPCAPVNPLFYVPCPSVENVPTRMISH